MSVLPRSLRRAAVTALTAGAVLASPMLALTPAFATEPEAQDEMPFVVLLNGGGISSTKHDGVSSTVQLLAQLSDPSHKVAAVRFRSAPITNGSTTTTDIGTVTTAPYTLAWTPSGEGQFELSVQALDADGVVLNRSSVDTTVSATASSVHLTSPTSGGELVLGPEHTVQVTGTRSADLPAVGVVALVWGQSDWMPGISEPVEVAAISPRTEESSNTWTAAVTVPACDDPAGCRVDFAAYTGTEQDEQEANGSTFFVESAPIVMTVPPAISGAAVQRAPYAGTFLLTGTAPANSQVTLHLHRQGTPAADYSLERTVVADSSGRWSRPIVATVEYRLYVTSAAYGEDAERSEPVHLAVTPTVNGARVRTVARNALVTLTGQAAPGSVVVLQVHQAGQSAATYAPERSVRADAHGRWNLTRKATGDVRVFVARAGASSSPVGQSTYLIQAR